MTTERFAVIDMGTNTFHLLIAERTNDGVVQFLVKEKCVVKIGQGGINQGYITEEAKQRALDALVAFKKTIVAFHVQHVYAAATSAMRNARNGQAIADEIFNTTGIPISIIDGQKEAELIFCGVKHAMNLGEGISLVMDIGGGSVEFVLCSKEKMLWKGSFEVGGQRLLERFHIQDPMNETAIEQQLAFLDEKLQPLYAICKQFPPDTLIGSSGSFDTLANMDLRSKGSMREIEDEKEYTLAVGDFFRMFYDFKFKSKAARRLIPGMIEMRVEMIVVACVLIEHILTTLNIHQLRISTYALKEGVLSKMLEGVEV